MSVYDDFIRKAGQQAKLNQANQVFGQIVNINERGRQAGTQRRAEQLAKDNAATQNQMLRQDLALKRQATADKTRKEQADRQHAFDLEDRKQAGRKELKGVDLQTDVAKMGVKQGIDQAAAGAKEGADERLATHKAGLTNRNERVKLELRKNLEITLQENRLAVEELQQTGQDTRHLKGMILQDYMMKWREVKKVELSELDQTEAMARMQQEMIDAQEKIEYTMQAQIDVYTAKINMQREMDVQSDDPARDRALIDRIWTEEQKRMDDMGENQKADTEYFVEGRFDAGAFQTYVDKEFVKRKNLMNAKAGNSPNLVTSVPFRARPVQKQPMDTPQPPEAGTVPEFPFPGTPQSTTDSDQKGDQKDLSQEGILDADSLQLEVGSEAYLDASEARNAARKEENRLAYEASREGQPDEINDQLMGDREGPYDKEGFEERQRTRFELKSAKMEAQNAAFQERGDAIRAQQGIFGDTMQDRTEQTTAQKELARNKHYKAKLDRDLAIQGFTEAVQSYMEGEEDFEQTKRNMEHPDQTRRVAAQRQLWKGRMQDPGHPDSDAAREEFGDSAFIMDNPKEPNDPSNGTVQVDWTEYGDIFHARDVHLGMARTFDLVRKGKTGLTTSEKELNFLEGVMASEKYYPVKVDGTDKYNLIPIPHFSTAEQMTDWVGDLVLNTGSQIGLELPSMLSGLLAKVPTAISEAVIGKNPVTDLWKDLFTEFATMTHKAHMEGTVETTKGNLVGMLDVAIYGDHMTQEEQDQRIYADPREGITKQRALLAKDKNINPIVRALFEGDQTAFDWEEMAEVALGEGAKAVGKRTLSDAQYKWMDDMLATPVVPNGTITLGILLLNLIDPGSVLGAMGKVAKAPIKTAAGVGQAIHDFNPIDKVAGAAYNAERTVTGLRDVVDSFLSSPDKAYQAGAEINAVGAEVVEGFRGAGVAAEMAGKHASALGDMPAGDAALAVGKAGINVLDKIGETALSLGKSFFKKSMEVGERKAASLARRSPSVRALSRVASVYTDSKTRRDMSTWMQKAAEEIRKSGKTGKEKAAAIAEVAQRPFKATALPDDISSDYLETGMVMETQLEPYIIPTFGTEGTKYTTDPFTIPGTKEGVGKTRFPKQKPKSYDIPFFTEPTGKVKKPKPRGYEIPSFEDVPEGLRVDKTDPFPVADFQGGDKQVRGHSYDIPGFGKDDLPSTEPFEVPTFYDLAAKHIKNVEARARYNEAQFTAAGGTPLEKVRRRPETKNTVYESKEAIVRGGGVNIPDGYTDIGAALSDNPLVTARRGTMDEFNAQRASDAFVDDLFRDIDRRADQENVIFDEQRARAERGSMTPDTPLGERRRPSTETPLLDAQRRAEGRPDFTPDDSTPMLGEPDRDHGLSEMETHVLDEVSGPRDRSKSDLTPEEQAIVQHLREPPVVPLKEQIQKRLSSEEFQGGTKDGMTRLGLTPEDKYGQLLREFPDMPTKHRTSLAKTLGLTREAVQRIHREKNKAAATVTRQRATKEIPELGTRHDPGRRKRQEALKDKSPFEPTLEEKLSGSSRARMLSEANTYYVSLKEQSLPATTVYQKVARKYPDLGGKVLEDMATQMDIRVAEVEALNEKTLQGEINRDAQRLVKAGLPPKAAFDAIMDRRELTLRQQVALKKKLKIPVSPNMDPTQPNVSLTDFDTPAVYKQEIEAIMVEFPHHTWPQIAKAAHARVQRRLEIATHDAIRENRELTVTPLTGELIDLVPSGRKLITESTASGVAVETTALTKDGIHSSEVPAPDVARMRRMEKGSVLTDLLAYSGGLLAAYSVGATLVVPMYLVGRLYHAFKKAREGIIGTASHTQLRAELAKITSHPLYKKVDTTHFSKSVTRWERKGALISSYQSPSSAIPTVQRIMSDAYHRFTAVTDAFYQHLDAAFQTMNSGERMYLSDHEDGVKNYIDETDSTDPNVNMREIYSTLDASLKAMPDEVWRSWVGKKPVLPPNATTRQINAFPARYAKWAASGNKLLEWKYGVPGTRRSAMKIVFAGQNDLPVFFRRTLKQRWRRYYIDDSIDFSRNHLVPLLNSASGAMPSSWSKAKYATEYLDGFHPKEHGLQFGRALTLWQATSTIGLSLSTPLKNLTQTLLNDTATAGFINNFKSIRTLLTNKTSHAFWETMKGPDTAYGFWSKQAEKVGVKADLQLEILGMRSAYESSIGANIMDTVMQFNKQYGFKAMQWTEDLNRINSLLANYSHQFDHFKTQGLADLAAHKEAMLAAKYIVKENHFDLSRVGNSPRLNNEWMRAGTGLVMFGARQFEWLMRRALKYHAVRRPGEAHGGTQLLRWYTMYTILDNAFAVAGLDGGFMGDFVPFVKDPSTEAHIDWADVEMKIPIWDIFTWDKITSFGTFFTEDSKLVNPVVQMFARGLAKSMGVGSGQDPQYVRELLSFMIPYSTALRRIKFLDKSIRGQREYTDSEKQFSMLTALNQNQRLYYSDFYDPKNIMEYLSRAETMRRFIGFGTTQQTYRYEMLSMMWGLTQPRMRRVDHDIRHRSEDWYQPTIKNIREVRQQYLKITPHGRKPDDIAEAFALMDKRYLGKQRKNAPPGLHKQDILDAYHAIFLARRAESDTKRGATPYVIDFPLEMIGKVGGALIEGASNIFGGDTPADGF